MRYLILALLIASTSADATSWEVWTKVGKAALVRQCTIDSEFISYDGTSNLSGVTIMTCGAFTAEPVNGGMFDTTLTLPTSAVFINKTEYHCELIATSYDGVDDIGVRLYSCH